MPRTKKQTEAQELSEGGAAATSVATTASKSGVILFGMIKQAGKLNDGITMFLKDYTDLGIRAHVLGVSAIYHACMHGNAAPLNNLFAGLRPNDQTAVRQYVKRIQIINGLGDEKLELENLDSDVVNAALDTGKVLDFAQNQFRIARGHTSEQAKTLAELCERRFLNPDGEKDKLIFARNAFAEVRALGESDVLGQIEQNVRSYLDNKSARRKITLSDAVRSKLVKIADQIGGMRSQTTLNEG